MGLDCLNWTDFCYQNQVLPSTCTLSKRICHVPFGSQIPAFKTWKSFRNLDFPPSWYVSAGMRRELQPGWSRTSGRAFTANYTGYLKNNVGFCGPNVGTLIFAFFLTCPIFRQYGYVSNFRISSGSLKKWPETTNLPVVSGKISPFNPNEVWGFRVVSGCFWCLINQRALSFPGHRLGLSTWSRGTSEENDRHRWQNVSLTRETTYVFLGLMEFSGQRSLSVVISMFIYSHDCWKSW